MIRNIFLPLLVLLCCLTTNAFASSLVKDINFKNNGIVEISVSQKSGFKVFVLDNPSRLVVDIDDSRLEKAESDYSLPKYISSFRGQNGDGNLRMVFELKQKIAIQRIHFEKVKNRPIGKIVINFTPPIYSRVVVEDGVKETPKIAQSNVASDSQDIANFVANKVEEFEVQTRKITNPDGSAKYVVTKIPKAAPEIDRRKTRDGMVKPIIIIDSGHGGKDPGTIGNYARSKEKNITLSYAKELGKQLVNSGRYKVYLTRDDDTFINLFERVQIARRKKADLFISLHANASPDKSTSGFSIYTLSETASDKQAEMLAQKENRADIISGMNFAGTSQDIVKTLIDMSQRDSKNRSAQFAETVIKTMKANEVEILQNTHRFAGFAVLTAPDMVSVLIELGYLSSKDEEKLLNSLTYKRKIADNLVSAIDQFFLKRP